MGRNASTPPLLEPAHPGVLALGRRDWLLLLLLTLFAFGLRAWRLDMPREQYFDEIYYMKAAQDYLDGREDSNTVHPPLGKIQIAAGMLLADRLDAWLGPGDDLPDTAEWRLTSLVAGTLMVPLTFLLAFRMSRGKGSLAACAAFLVAVDFMALAISRIAMLDSVLSLWILVGLYASWRYLEEAELGDPHRWTWATAAALAFGVATACKWNGLFAAFGACLVMVGFGAPSRLQPEAEPTGSGRERLLRWVGPPVLMALLIPLVYALSYGFLFYHEGTLGAVAWEKIYGFHKLMISFRSDPKQFSHRYLSYFWEWPLVLRPIWFYYQAEQGRVSGIVAFGSILFWWTSLLYLFEVGVVAVTRRDRACTFLVVTWVCQWLLWASSRTGGFIYYLLPGVPLLAVATAMVLDEWQETGGRAVSLAYLAGVVVFFVAYFPFLTALPATQHHFDVVFPVWAGRWR